MTAAEFGSWAGTTAQDSTITCQVSAGGITTLTFGYRATGSSCSVDGKTTTNVPNADPDLERNLLAHCFRVA